MADVCHVRTRGRDSMGDRWHFIWFWRLELAWSERLKAELKLAEALNAPGGEIFSYSKQEHPRQCSSRRWTSCACVGESGPLGLWGLQSSYCSQSARLSRIVGARQNNGPAADLKAVGAGVVVDVHTLKSDYWWLSLSFWHQGRPLPRSVAGCQILFFWCRYYRLLLMIAYWLVWSVEGKWIILSY